MLENPRRSATDQSEAKETTPSDTNNEERKGPPQPNLHRTSNNTATEYDEIHSAYRRAPFYKRLYRRADTKTSVPRDSGMTTCGIFNMTGHFTGLERIPYHNNAPHCDITMACPQGLHWEINIDTHM